MTRVFFYGLFMDVALLESKGLHPELARPARLDGFVLRIANKASLVPQAGACSYGMVIDLPDRELAALYAEPGVQDYRREDVVPVLLVDETRCPSACYNLAEDQLSSTANVAYANELADLVAALGFPAAYAREIRQVQGQE